MLHIHSRHRVLVLVLLFLSLSSCTHLRSRHVSTAAGVTRLEALAFVEEMARIFNANDKGIDDILPLIHDDAILLGSANHVWTKRAYADACVANRARYEQTVAYIEIDVASAVATVALDCARATEHGKQLYRIILVLEKHDGRIGIARRERRDFALR